MTLKKQAISGVKWTTFSTVIVTLLQLLQISILARFLKPEDFGLMAIVMVVIGFSQSFLDMGISNAIIHKQEITHKQLSTLYWLNVLTGFFLFIIIVLIAPLVAVFYANPKLTELITLIGVSFLIQPFGQQFMVLLQKELRFREISQIDIINKIISLTVSVWFAYKGYGVYSLIYGSLAGVITQTLQFLTLGLKEHKPSLVFNLNETKEFLSFGMYQMGERTINYFNSQIDVILIGKLLGNDVLGIYSLAKQIIMRPAQIFNPIITKVTFPAMAKVQNDELLLRSIYIKTINVLSSVNFPIYALMIVLAPELVLILFGKQWEAVIPIVQILSIYGALRSTGNPIGSLLLAKGKAKLGFYWNLGLFFYIPAGIYVGSHWGVIGVSWALVFLTFPFLIIANWYFLVRPLCSIKFIEYHSQILKPLIFAIIGGACGYGVGVLFNTQNMVLNAIVVSMVMLFVVILFNNLYNKTFINTLFMLIK